MRLVIVNDLPLLRDVSCPVHLDRLIRIWMGVSGDGPAELEYWSFEEFTRAWVRAASHPCDVLVAVGTRPSLLANTRLEGVDTVSVHPIRSHAPDGTTQKVLINQDPWSLIDSEDRVHVAEDLIFSGLTLHAILAGLARIGVKQISVGAVAATRVGLKYICERHFVAVMCQRMLPFDPVVGGTTIFLHDLLFGSLLGRPFRECHDLLRPFLRDPKCVEPLRAEVIRLTAARPNGELMKV